MELIPAIDLLEGRVVRLERGDYERVTVYDEDPARTAHEFEAAGAKRLHIVDLDGARAGRAGNERAIASILDATSLEIQVGGGLRDRQSIDHWFERGVRRVVLGTIAIKDPRLAAEVCRTYPGRVIVAIDARDGRVAVEGWLEQSTVTAVDLARQAQSFGASAALFTNIDRDGTREGPDVEGTIALQRLVDIDIIASGGIGNLEHLIALRDAGVRAAVCGRALYAGAFTLAEALTALEESCLPGG